MGFALDWTDFIWVCMLGVLKRAKYVSGTVISLYRRYSENMRVTKNEILKYM